MTTEVGIGSGAEFWFENSLGVLTKWAEILSVPIPDVQTDEVEATHMGSGGFREFIAGLKDAGEGSFELNYVPSSPTSENIRQAHSSGETRGYKIVLPCADGSTWEITGDGWIKGRSREVPLGERMTQTVTLRFTGEPDEAAGA